jgi:glycosyltransferase involved in cell wall biosynthesis
VVANTLADSLPEDSYEGHEFLTVTGMRISAVLIVYNLEAYVGQAIDSVLGQTRRADEIIVVDDCSTDRSAERIKAYGDKLRYLRMPKNSGALLAALHGVKTAGGDVVCMLDGDDIWAANKLETVEREFLAEPEMVLLSHDHVRMDAHGAELPVRDDTHRNIAALRRRAKSREELSCLLRATVLEQKGYWLGSAYAFRKGLFDIPRFDGQIESFGFEELRQTYLDLVIAPFLVLTNPHKTVGYTPDTRFFYRVHDQGSLGGNESPEKARQSALKGRKINELIDLILRANKASPDHLRRRERILRHYDYLCALYAGDFLIAARLYARLAGRHWNWAELRKETKRFLAVRTLGIDRFLALKQGADGLGATARPGRWHKLWQCARRRHR